MRNKIKNIFNNRKTLSLVLCLVLVSVFTLTIAYAALNTVLKINGTAEVSAASWDIYLDNVQLYSGSATSTAPTITDKTTASFSTTLTNPGDYYEFSIDVVNNGSIDAMIDSIEKTSLSEVQAKYLNYTVEYQTGESITTKQLVKANSFVRLKVKVEFKKDLNASDLPTTTETLNLSFTLKYIQATETGTSNVTDNGVKLVNVMSGDYDTVGSEICIGSECFYVISSTEDTVTMLAKYNLYVGNECTSPTSCTPYGEEATGMQDSKMKGYESTYYTRYGVTAFGENNEYSGSKVEEYVNAYHTNLEKLGIVIIESRLITRDEVETLGCSMTEFNCNNSKYSFVYDTSYWTSTADAPNYVWYVYSDRRFGCYEYNMYIGAGVRPVITISKSQ